MNEVKTYYGIDLGTNNCVISFIHKKDKEITLEIAKRNNLNSTKTIVGIEDLENITIGKQSIDMIKKSFNRIKGKLGNERKVKINNQDISVQFCGALILNYLIQVDKGMEDIVITIPSFYNQNMRNSTIESAKQAGFKKVKLIEEPSAAAMYHLYKQYKNNKLEYLVNSKNILIFDFGCGTLDLSLVQVDIEFNGEIKPHVVKIAGLDNFGGYLIDLILAEVIMVQALETINRDEKKELELAYDKLAYHLDAYKDRNNDELYVHDDRTNELIYLFLNEAENIKIKLSSTESTSVNVENYIKNKEISRKEFNDIVFNESGISNKIINLLKEFKLSNKEQIDEVVLVGGTSRIKEVQRIVEELFSNCKCINEDDYIYAVSYGASIINAINNGLEVEPFGSNLCHGVIPRNIYLIFNGIEQLIIESGTPYPFSKPKEIEVEIPFSLSTSLNIEILERDSEKEYKISSVDFYHPCFFTGDKVLFNIYIDENGLAEFKAIHKETEEELEFLSNRENSLNEKQIDNGRQHILNKVKFREV